MFINRYLKYIRGGSGSPVTSFSGVGLPSAPPFVLVRDFVTPDLLSSTLSPNLNNTLWFQDVEHRATAFQ